MYMCDCVGGWVFVFMFNLHLCTCTCATVLVGAVVMYETIVNVLFV